MKKWCRKIAFILTVTGIIHFFSCGENDNNHNYNNSAEKEMIPQLDSRIFTNLDSAVIAGKAEQLDRKFARLQRLTGFNGTVLYSEKGRVILEKAYGFADVRHRKDSLTVHSAFQLASVSKMFAAMAIMILRKEGKIDYDTDIRKYIPDFPYDNVTCRLLMNQRTGLPRYMSLAHAKWKNKKKPLDNDKMMELFIKYRPSVYFKPNHGFHYCNTNYAVLANVVEAVTGQYFDKFVEEKIFKPLGMNDSFVYNLRGDTIVPLYIDKGVPGYYRRGWRWREMENDYLNGVMGDKNVYTSVDDLYKYDRALDNFTLVPDTILREAFKKGSPDYWRRKYNYGFGWKIPKRRDSTVYHFGWWKGFRTFYIRDMRHQRTLIVLTNKDKGPGSANMWNVFDQDTLKLGFYCDLKIKKAANQ
jgi:CubicO group peptidase (beta-lactamase class C family)